MSDSGIDAQRRLEAWRAHGADRVDPLRFARIEALARRTAGERGAVRALLDARLAQLFDAYAADVARMPSHATFGGASSTEPDATQGVMTTLLQHLERETAGRDDRSAHASAGARAAAAAATSSESVDGPASDAVGGAPRGADMLDELRRASRRARTESQMRQALQDAPANAGPLNSSSLVHRALNLMRDAAPGYLLPFMAYVDALASLEGMGLHDAQAADALPASASGAKRPRGKPRTRRS